MLKKRIYILPTTHTTTQPNLQWNTTKAGEHIPRGSLVSTIWALDGIENKHDECKG